MIAGSAAGAATTVSTSVLAPSPITLMGSGTGAVQVPEVIQAAGDAR